MCKELVVNEQIWMTHNIEETMKENLVEQNLTRHLQHLTDITILYVFIYSVFQSE